MKTILSTGVAALLMTASAQAGEYAKDVKATAPAERSRWSLSAGAAFRQIDANLRLEVNAPGLFRGGDPIRYDDGVVGPDGFERDGAPFNNDGTALGTISRRSQVRDTGRVDVPGFTLSEVRLHAFEVDDSRNEDDLGTGGFVQLRYGAMQTPKLDLNALVGYSWTTAEVKSANHALAGQTRGYRYDHSSAFSGITLPGARFPFEDDTSSTIYDAARYNAFYGTPNAIDPRESGDGRNGISARGFAKLDLDLHEIVLAPELQWNVTEAVHVGLSVGPTINVFDSTLRARVTTRGPRGGGREYRLRHDSTEVRIGVAAQAALTVDLTRRFFFEAASGYRYVPRFDVGEGFAHATVDASSWETKVGFGVRF